MYLEREAIYYVTNPPKVIVLISRARVNIDANPREGTRESFGSHAQAIRKARNLVEFNRVLYL